MTLFAWTRDAGAPTPSEQQDPVMVPRVVRTTTPAAVATAEELAAELKVSVNAEGAYLTRLIAAATAWCEAWTGQAFATRSVEVWFDQLPAGVAPFELPNGPYSAVANVKTYNVDDEESTLETTVYQADLLSLPARIFLRAGQSWPTNLRRANAIKITGVAGYAEGQVPDGIKAAVLNMASETYLLRGRQVDSRESRAVVPTADTLLLLEPYKVIR